MKFPYFLAFFSQTANIFGALATGLVKLATTGKHSDLGDGRVRYVILQSHVSAAGRAGMSVCWDVCEKSLTQQWSTTPSPTKKLQWLSIGLKKEH